MKSFIAIVALAFAATTAHAGNVSVGAEYEFFNGTSGAADSNSIAVIPSYKLGPITADVKLQHTRTDVKDIFNTVEARAKYDFALSKAITASARVGYGVAFVPNGRSEFYTIEPGVAYAVTPALAVNASYRFRDAFASSVGNSNTVFVGADYAVHKKDVVGFKLFRETGDHAGNGATVEYTRSF